MANRKENVENEDIVIWHSFGLTHNPRIEGQPHHASSSIRGHSANISASIDWPVMYAALP
jgi:hypothetical protein